MYQYVKGDVLILRTYPGMGPTARHFFPLPHGHGSLRPIPLGLPSVVVASTKMSPYIYTSKNALFMAFAQLNTLQAKPHISCQKLSCSDRLAGTTSVLSCFGAVEKIRPSNGLAVVPILDLDPGRRIGRVPGACLFRDNPLHVAIANHLEQFRAACHVIHIQDRLRAPREQLPKESLPIA